MTSTLPANVHISTHPCLQAKLSQLRATDTSPREVKALIHEISLIVAVEALAHGLKGSSEGTAKSMLGYDYPVQTVFPDNIVLVPILRSGLGMVDAIQTILPNAVPVHHLGLFREPSTLSPVEYYNNLPSHSSSRPSLALLVDPIVATGGTSAAAIQTLKEWGVQKIIQISVLGSVDGVKRAAEEGGENMELWVGGCDDKTDASGMIIPGLGDVGDRLFLTSAKRPKVGQ
ncbi:MAG: hypothetical protein M1834_001075 [Cirrosporium novae-zelandiae]|nr:MAG: hypothetical protein M1834_001075 [Cirrosporium novae-zelandiae]